MFELILILMGVNLSPHSSPPSVIDYCKIDIEHLPLDIKIELMIGCSNVNGRRVYYDHKLRRLYEHKKQDSL